MITTADGHRLDLEPWSLRELALATTDYWGRRVYLTLARDQVAELRDELTAWLARGEL